MKISDKVHQDLEKTACFSTKLDQTLPIMPQDGGNGEIALFRGCRFRAQIHRFVWRGGS